MSLSTGIGYDRLSMVDGQLITITNAQVILGDTALQ